MTPINLDELKAMEAKATPAQWHIASDKNKTRRCITTRNGALASVYCDEDAPHADPVGKANIDLIVKLRNAAPSLIAELERARPIVEAAMNLVGVYDALDNKLIQAHLIRNMKRSNVACKCPSPSNPLNHAVISGILGSTCYCGKCGGVIAKNGKRVKKTKGSK